MASFTLNELRAFARSHNKQHNVKISQRKMPLHNDLKDKGVKMPQSKAYTGLGKFKQKKAVKKTVKKKARKRPVRCLCGMAPSTFKVAICEINLRARKGASHGCVRNCQTGARRGAAGPISASPRPIPEPPKRARNVKLLYSVRVV